MAQKSRSSTAAPNPSATRKAPAPPESKETVRERYTRILSTNPRWHEAPKSGTTFIIGGVRPVKK